jgi:DNA-directed RNA polymerase specialized sigma24 family protein
MPALAPPGAPAPEVVDRVPADAVHRAVLALPEDLRIALYLSDVEGLSHREAARVMGTSASVAAARLQRARSWLGACLAPAILNAIR